MMIQQLFNMVWTLCVGKLLLNDVSHMLDGPSCPQGEPDRIVKVGPNPTASFYRSMTGKVFVRDGKRIWFSIQPLDKLEEIRRSGMRPEEIDPSIVEFVGVDFGILLSDTVAALDGFIEGPTLLDQEEARRRYEAGEGFAIFEVEIDEHTPVTPVPHPYYPDSPPIAYLSFEPIPPEHIRLIDVATYYIMEDGETIGVKWSSFG